LHDRLPAQDGSPFGTVLLGFVDVRHTGGTNPAQLRLETGPQGTVPSNGNFTFGIQFGYNDAMVPAAAANATSAIADAFILPPIVGADHTEIEPNNTKLRATPVIPIQSGQRLRGRTTGNLAGAGEASADYWLIGSPPEDFVRIYRHRLALESTTPGHTLTMRGHLQGNGFIDRGSDATIATAVASTNPPRHIDWYSFGRREMAYFRVVGTSTTTSHYDLLYSRTPVTPVSLGSFVEGTITISTHGQGHSTDTDLWLYDAHLQAIPLAGNQHTPLGNRATLTRLLAPGVYYLALSTSNLANDQGQPADDALPFDPVTDFPGIVLNSTTSTGQNLAFAITDANRTATFAASHSEPFLVYWGQFQVLPGCGVDFNGDLNIDPDDLADYIAAYFGGC
ncbi:MAG: hypothetical protein JNK35_02035, partial [Phycisphaerae bacterium]|nr:hypothetical protein [Phycisphaerae bacterium]